MSDEIADPYELAAEADALDVEPDDDSTKVMDLIPEGLDRAGSTRTDGAIPFEGDES